MQAPGHFTDNDAAEEHADTFRVNQRVVSRAVNSMGQVGIVTGIHNKEARCVVVLFPGARVAVPHSTDFLTHDYAPAPKPSEVYEAAPSTDNPGGWVVREAATRIIRYPSNRLNERDARRLAAAMNDAYHASNRSR